MPEATPDAERLVNTYLDIWTGQEYSKISDTVSESFVMYDPVAPVDEVGPAGEVHGPDGLEEWMREVTSGFPDFQVEILDVLSSENLVMYEASHTGTHAGEVIGIPPTERVIEIRSMETYRIADGKIQEHRVYLDQRELAHQLGLTFPAVIWQLPKLVRRKLRTEL